LAITDINETSPLLNHKWVPVTKAWHVLRWWMEKWPPTRKAAANILNKQSQTADKGWNSSLGVGWGAKLLTIKNYHITKHSKLPWTWTDPVVQPKQWKRNMKFGTTIVRSLHRSGSLTTAARELARYKLDLVSV